YIGFIPDTEFISNLNITNEEGYILVNDKYETDIKGIYAIGDIIKKDVYQIGTAVADGIIAVTDIIEK
ncbi:MAG TPA: thioredoxin reductase, partial [Firmicutes bacterium]|nr:thioredoxin reductase [Bacillota bacterium]